mmetsp:Transcript_10113/g.35434  ORF Transcript_10113/g.35434 Transcript_10113/m.35434 type:complete len:201 (+) Transcript_10113:87-689(+)
MKSASATTTGSSTITPTAEPKPASVSGGHASEPCPHTVTEPICAQKASRRKMSPLGVSMLSRPQASNAALHSSCVGGGAPQISPMMDGWSLATFLHVNVLTARAHAESASPSTSPTLQPSKVHAPPVQSTACFDAAKSTSASPPATVVSMRLPPSTWQYVSVCPGTSSQSAEAGAANTSAATAATAATAPTRDIATRGAG